jgi:hypothetical protein
MEKHPLTLVVFVVEMAQAALGAIIFLTVASRWIPAMFAGAMAQRVLTAAQRRRKTVKP